MKKLIVILILIYLPLIFITSQDNPKLPDEPILKNDKIIKNSNNKNIIIEEKNNIKYQNKKGEITEGVAENLKGIYLNLAWSGNEIGSQKILLDFVKSIKINGYSKIKKTKENLSIIFYFPDTFDLELKDGKIIKNAKGRINEIESFLVYNSIGKQKCYTYFIRYWLEDKQIFNDNKSFDYNEKPVIPDSVITYIEFIN
jgi:hypothetical protein